MDEGNVLNSIAIQFLKSEVTLDILVRAGLTTYDEYATLLAAKKELLQGLSRQTHLEKDKVEAPRVFVLEAPHEKG